MAATARQTPHTGLVRPLAWYFGGLGVFYVAGLVVFWPDAGEEPNDLVFLVLMFAPTVGALFAQSFGGARIQWGRPNRWVLVSLIPAVVVLLAYLLGAQLGWETENPDLLVSALVAAPFAILSATLSAVGEEIGWRGMLWPTLRSSYGYLRTSLLIGVVWWLYHVPLVLIGWYGEVSGLPAFTVSLFGFTLFVGALTDRSRSLWPSAVAHGAWNGLVATSFAVTEGSEQVPAFSGSDALLGEFGWLAAASMLIVGGATALWHSPTDLSDN